MKSSYHLLALCAFLFTTFLSLAQNKTFKTNNGKLFDAKGNEFIIKGVNNPHYWFPVQSYFALDTLAGLKCNTIRIVWETGGNPSELQKIIERVVQLKMIAIPEIHNATGKNDIAALEEAARYWAKDEIKKILNDYKPYVILNIANEWVKNGDTLLWFNGYKSAIKIIREAGMDHCLLIDAAGWGQDIGPIKLYAKALTQFDSCRNLLFDVHMYGSWNDADKIKTELSYLTENEIPIIVGEFGYNYNNGTNNLGCKVNPYVLLETCHSLGIGFMPWSWTGNNTENQWLDLANPADWYSLTDWGKLVFHHQYGITKNALPCSVFSK